MDKITLVQKAVDLAEYREMLFRGKLPLVVKLSENEDDLEEKEFSHYPFAKLYYNTYGCEAGFKHYFLHADHLRETIERKQIFIPDFIVFNGNTRYVNYISKSNFMEFGECIIFRDKKRLFKGAQAKFSIQRNYALGRIECVQTQIGGISEIIPVLCPTRHSENSEELFRLCTGALYHSNPGKEGSPIQKKIQALQ